MKALLLTLLCMSSMATMAQPAPKAAAEPKPAEAKPAPAKPAEAKPAEAPPPDPTLSTLQGRILQPEKVTARVREALKRKMRNHSKDFTPLSLAIVFANYPEVDRATRGIMNEPRIDKASLGDEQAGLSDYFFQLQNELRERAGALNKAAAQRELSGMTAAMGELTQTCATCHLVFREPLVKKEGKK